MGSVRGPRAWLALGLCNAPDSSRRRARESQWGQAQATCYSIPIVPIPSKCAPSPCPRPRGALGTRGYSCRAPTAGLQPGSQQQQPGTRWLPLPCERGSGWGPRGASHLPRPGRPRSQPASALAPCQLPCSSGTGAVLWWGWERGGWLS